MSDTEVNKQSKYSRTYYEKNREKIKKKYREKYEKKTKTCKICLIRYKIEEKDEHRVTREHKMGKKIEELRKEIKKIKKLIK